MYFSKKLKVTYLPETIIGELQGKNVVERIAYLEKKVDELEKQWYGG
jgi:hypothetical protein